jgi:energy-coupling factor transporter ATP-binding protein EcfA2
MNEPIEPIEGAEALTNYAQAIRDWQSTRPTKLSDEALIRRYPGLGSTKTYKRILGGDTAELRVDEWTERYRGVLTQIETEEAETAGSEELYDDLEPARAVRTAINSVVRSVGIERFVVIEGDTGSGKTSSLALIERLYPGAASRVEASVGWRSFAAAMADIAIAVGVADDANKLPLSGAGRLDAVIRHLGESRRLVLIDEGHHMTADVLNALKTLINRTGARIVVAAQSTLWRKLQASSLQEAKQLLLNRLRSRVHLAAPSHQDAALYIYRRCGVDLGDGASIEIARLAGRGGNYAFLRRLGAALLEMPKDACEATALEAARNLSHTLA